jgi:replicative DNA helicase
MDKNEIQTIILAYLSGINEEHILMNNFEQGEEERLEFAMSIMEKYENYFIFEEISDPNLVNVEATIKKYVTMDKVKYVFYDYIHSTASMMAQFERTGLREESILMMMSNQLKQIAKDYNVFIYSATQVNATGMADDGEFKSMTAIRGAKSIADKIDGGYVITKINNKMWNSFVGAFRQGAREGIIDYSCLDNEEERPTHVFDIYKNRRGRLKDVRIWSRLDLGTGERKDLFITTASNIPIKIPNNEIFQTRSEIINWRDMLQKGIED